VLTVAYHFPVDELWVSADLLGQSIPTERQGYRCRVVFPEDEASFGMANESDGPLGGGWSGTIENPRQRVGVAILRVEVELATAIDADDIPLGGPVKEAEFKELHGLLGRAADVARSIVSDLLRWARVELEQFWITPQFDPPRTTWMTIIHDDQGRRLGTGYHDGFRVFVDGTLENALRPEGVLAALDATSSDWEASLPGELLADARFYTLRPAALNPNLGVFLAAIAAEVAIRRFLADHATDEQGELVGLLLENRMISLAAVSLYDKGLKAVIGHSLREDDKDAYVALDSLFQVRNRVAHKGAYSVGPEEASRHLKAAARALEYLRDIHGG